MNLGVLLYVEAAIGLVDTEPGIFSDIEDQNRLIDHLQIAEVIIPPKAIVPPQAMHPRWSILDYWASRRPGCSGLGCTAW